MTQNFLHPPHGGQLDRIAERFNIPASALLDFSANINPEGPPSSSIDALRKAIDTPATLANYPDLEETELRRSISGYANIAPENIAVANGFVPLLEAALRTLPIHSCRLPIPAFGEYRSALNRARIAITPYTLDRQTDFRYDPDKLIAAITSEHNAILLANPQNPSGVLCERATLTTLIHEAAKRGVYVLLDEAFIDYAPTQSLADEVENYPNLIVFRSVTKFHGMPAMRVAYAAARSTVANTLRESLPPWPITTLASIAVCAALADAPYAEQTLQLNHKRREHLIAQLTALGLYIYPTGANFLLIRFPKNISAEDCWQRLIREHGIVLRHCGNFEGLQANHLRCAVRNEEQNSRLVANLSAVLQQMR